MSEMVDFECISLDMVRIPSQLHINMKFKRLHCIALNEGCIRHVPRSALAAPRGDLWCSLGRAEARSECPHCCRMR